MSLAERGEKGAADKLFEDAWGTATQDLEKLIVAYCAARHQSESAAKLRWLNAALQAAQNFDDERVQSAFPAFYAGIAQCYADLGEPGLAEKNRAAAASFKEGPSALGPFYHGTRADLKVGDLLTAGGGSNYKPDLKMNHIYFTALAKGARLAAALAKGDQKERVYIIEPTGSFEDDPNVTNKKFPGNLTRSYRSEAPLRIIGELASWQGPSPEELVQWRNRLAGNKGEIIN